MSSKPVIALLLPGYSPTLSWLARAIYADRVILDDLHPFSRKSQCHRTKIRTPNGFQWLRIPFVSDDRRKPLNEVRIDHSEPWLSHHIQALEYNYRNSLYFDFYEPEIRSDLQTAAENDLLLDAVSHLMKRQWLYLQLPKFPEWASQCSFSPPISNDKKNSLVNSQPNPASTESACIVWQEEKSRNYQKPHPDVASLNVITPEYRQHFPGFVPACGLLDMLFEYGPDSWQIIDQLRTTET